DWLRVGDPDDTVVEALALASGEADVVTSAVRLPDGARQLFLGEPGALGVVENQYGVVGLVRREAAALVEPHDSPWVFFARLALSGARILSLPDALARHTPQPPATAD